MTIRKARCSIASAILAFGISALYPALADNHSHTLPAAPSLKLARQNVGSPLVSAVTFRQMDAFFPVDAVETTPGPTLPYAIKPFNFSLNMNGKNLTLAQALEATHTNALVVIKDGTIIYESYYNGADENSRFIAWSISKSITSILLGIAKHDGFIDSLDDTVGKYVPEAQGSPFEDVSLHNMLQMQAGTSYEEMSFDRVADIYLLKAKSLDTGEKRFTDQSILNLTRTSTPGTVFNYSTLTASMLGRVVEEATGRTLAEYMEAKLWKPAGMQQSGYWLLDGVPGKGQAFAGGGFNATARDLARLGLLMLQRGQINGKQVIPADWVDASTHYERTEAVIPEENRGYQYQWWTFLGTEIYEAIGVYGQYISVDPTTNTVIVKLSAWPEKGGLQYELQNKDVFDAIRHHIITPQP